MLSVKRNAVERYFDSVYFRLNHATASPRRPGVVFRRDENRIVEHACDLLMKRPVGSLLDLGCGAGRLLGEIQRSQSALREAVGVDLSPSTLSVARNRLAHDRRFSFECAAVETCEALSRRYDAVVSLGLLDYVRLTEPLLARLLASSSSQIVLTAPVRRLRPQRLLRRAWLRLNGVRLHSYRQQDIAALCARAGGAAWRFDIGRPEGLLDNIWIHGRRIEAVGSV